MQKKSTSKTSVGKRVKAQEMHFLTGGGEMGALIRAKDWSKTPLGAVAKWPQGLRFAMNICLGSAFPIAIYWGKELTLLYNDAWSPIPGNKHPRALGQSAIEVWPDIWVDIEPLFKKVFFTGEASRSIDALLPMQRHGYIEECYFDFTFTPIRGENGRVEGVFNAVIETTFRVISERRSAMLKELAAKLNPAQSIEEIFAVVKSELGKAVKDIPFALIYLNADDNQRSNLVCATGSATGAPLSADLSGKNPAVFPFAQITDTAGSFHVTDNNQLFDGKIQSAWPEPAVETLILPIGINKVIGYFVAGINPRRKLDADYRDFLKSITSHISTTIYNVQSLAEERKRAEAFEEIDRAKTLFFSNVSHEFRTPLTLMLGPLQDLLQEDVRDEQRKTLELMHRNGLRLQKLVNTLLDFSRIEAGKARAHFTPVDLAAYTAELAGNFDSAIKKAGMELLVKTPTLSEKVYVDKDMWEKIVLNLLSNAFKFTFQGEIEVVLKENRSEVILKVRDTGEGIPAKDLPHIFERFKRVEHAKSRTFEGSGIGLALVQELVKLHGGSIEVESVEGKGTTFTVRIPKGNKHLPQERIQEQQDAPATTIDTRAYINEAVQWLNEDLQPSGENRADARMFPGFSRSPKILLADDNADMRNYVKRVLEDRFQIIAVSNGNQALEEVYKEIPDLILTDVMMPGLDGFGLMKKLKSNAETARIPVIMLSARAGEEAKIEGIEAGADDYLLKPFSTNELIARVSALITTSRTRRETEDYLYELFMQAPAVIAVLHGPELVFKLANPMYRKVVGAKRNIVGKPVREALPELEGQGYFELLENVYKTGVPFYGNEMQVNIDREETGTLTEAYFNFICQPSKNLDGKIDGILVHAVEVTDLVLANKKAQEKEVSLRARVQQQAVVTELGLLALSGTDLRSLMNTAVQLLKKVLEVEYAKVLELLPEGDKVILRAGAGWNKDIVIDQSTFDSSVNSQAGYVLLAKEPVIVKDLRTETRFHGSSLLTDHGVVSGMSCILWGRDQNPYGVLGVHSTKSRDFTHDDIIFLQAVANVLATAIQRKQNEEELHKKETDFRTLADNISNLCWMADANGWIYWYNSRWYQYTGTTPEDMEGWGWQSVHDPEILPIVMNKWKKSLETGEFFDMVFPLKGADGVFRPFLTRVVPVKDAQGKVQKWFGTNTDITERENLAKQKDEFISIASHELKTPLTSVKGYIQIIDELFREKAYDTLGDLLKSAQLNIDRLATLINDLLDVSKLQAGKMQYELSEFEVKEIVQDSIDQVRHLSKKHHIKVQGDLSVSLYGDKMRLEQVLNNLLSNAIKYSPGGNDILVHVSSENGWLKVAITDSGIGIPKEKIPYLFDRFFRVHHSTNRYQGLGLGLYICSEIIKRHGGRIDVESIEGKGSTFYVVMPLKPQTARTEEVEPAASNSLPGKKEGNSRSSI